MAISDILNAQKVASNKKTLDAQNFDSLIGQLNKAGIIDPSTQLLKNDGTEASGLKILTEGNEQGFAVRSELVRQVLNDNDLFKNSLKVIGDDGKPLTKKQKRKLNISGLARNEDGSFSIMLDSPLGPVPKTLGFSDDPNDFVVKLSPSETESAINLSLGTSLGKYKPGTVTGDAINQQAQQVFAKLQQDVDDDKVSVEDAADISARLIDLVEQNKDPDKIAAANSGTSYTTPGIKDAEFQRDDVELSGKEKMNAGLFVIDPSSPDVQKAQNILENTTAGDILSDSEVDAISKGLSPGFQNAFIKNYAFSQKQLELTDAEISRLEGIDNKTPQQQTELNRLKNRRDNVQIPGLQKQLDRIKTNIADDTAAIDTVRQKKIDDINKKIGVKKTLLSNPRLTPDRRKEIEGEVQDLEKQLPGATPVASAPLGITPVPTDPSEYQKWYDTNADAIKQLAQEKQDEIRKLIAENPEINSVNDLGKLKGKVDNFGIAAVLASQSPYANDVDSFVKLWAGITNALDTGSPTTTALDRAKFDQDVKMDQFTIEKFFKELSDKGEKAASALMEEFGKILFDEKGGYKKLNNQDRSNLRRNIVNLSAALKNIQGNEGLPYEKQVIGSIFKAVVAAEGSVDFPDWVSDIFAGNDPNNLGVLIDQTRLRTKKIKTRGGKEIEVIDEVYFVDAAGNETEGSLKQPEIIKYFGPQGSEIRARLLSLIAKDDPRS